MISDLLFMKGYGVYVWTSFAFTLICFGFLYGVTKIQFVKEKKKFIAKFGALKSEKAIFAKSQSINKEILSNTSKI
tara:strand:- start:66 stop:293 length:228 start_codon:yes stop_codon:yes gene_type:complete